MIEAGQRVHVEKPNPLTLLLGARSPEREISCWQLNPRPTLGSNGMRTIMVEARSANETLEFALTAGEAAMLMLDLGYALEQAARLNRPNGIIGRARVSTRAFA